MCGRYTITLTAAEIAEIFGLPRPGFTSAPRFNVAPTQEVPIIVSDPLEQSPRLILARFGLIPHWAKDESIASRLINARAETVHEKPSFRRAFLRSRCLIPAAGFYEWKADGKRKQPYLITPGRAGAFTFGGVHEVWQSPDGGEVHSFSIITTAASPDLAPIHHRMPLMLADTAEREVWLHSQDSVQVSALLVPYSGSFRITPVSTLVNSPANDTPECIVPIAEPPSLF